MSIDPSKRAATLLRYKEKNAQKIRERDRAWYHANKHRRDKTKVAEYNHTYGKMNPRTKTPEQSSADQKRYYERHKERLRIEALEKYHTTAKHKIDRVAQAAYNKSYRASNPDRFKLTSEEKRRHQARFKYKYATDPEFRSKFLERQKQYRKNNPEIGPNRKARRRAWSGDDRLTRGLTARLLISQNGCCNYCKSPFGNETPHRDHIEPLSKGGRNIDENIQLLCRRCNQLKSATLSTELNLTELVRESIAMRTR